MTPHESLQPDKQRVTIEKPQTRYELATMLLALGRERKFAEIRYALDDAKKDHESDLSQRLRETSNEGNLDDSLSPEDIVLVLELCTLYGLDLIDRPASEPAFSKGRKLIASLRSKAASIFFS